MLASSAGSAAGLAYRRPADAGGRRVTGEAGRGGWLARRGTGCGRPRARCGSRIARGGWRGAGTGSFAELGRDGTLSGAGPAVARAAARGTPDDGAGGRDAAPGCRCWARRPSLPALAAAAEVFTRGVPVDWAAVFGWQRRAAGGPADVRVPAAAVLAGGAPRRGRGGLTRGGLAAAGHPLLAAAVGAGRGRRRGVHGAAVGGGVAVAGVITRCSGRCWCRARRWWRWRPGRAGRRAAGGCWSWYLGGAAGRCPARAPWQVQVRVDEPDAGRGPGGEPVFTRPRRGRGGVGAACVRDAGTRGAGRAGLAAEAGLSRGVAAGWRGAAAGGGTVRADG